MSLSKRAFVFDIDGVIVDSNPHHRQAWEAFNRSYGLETTAAMHQFMYGRRNDQIVREFFGAGLSAEEVDTRGAAKEALYRKMISGHVEGMLVAGLTEFLDRYRDVSKAVASNGEPANVDFLLEESGLRPYFQVVLNGHQVSQPKPDPEIYLRAAELLKVEPAACIVFEDSYSGVEAGRAAGMSVIGISTTHEYLAGTVLTVDNFTDGDLREWLEAQVGAAK